MRMSPLLALSLTVVLFGADVCATPSAGAQEPATPITVFVAKKIVTMDPTRPTATAVAVRDGMVLGVGSLEDLAPWLKTGKYTVNEQFKHKVLMPGFIDPHMHPMLGAIQFGTTWITPEPWSVLGEKIPATIGHDAYLRALKAAFAAAPKTEPMFITWGYNQMFHGDMSREILDAISNTYPIFVWHRSAHEAYFNTPMLKYLAGKGLTEEKVMGIRRSTGRKATSSRMVCSRRPCLYWQITCWRPRVWTRASPRRATT
ncbi:MAG: amidohydrolase family protein [Nitrospira sp.]|nr:amidohydrolase family protein [Nitrospira sp.]